MTSILPPKIFDCIYGAPGAGKSELVARLLELQVRERGKKIRIAIGDGSALTYQHLADAGYAEIMEFSHRKWPMDTLTQLSRGWWPADPLDPASPLVAPKPQDIASLGAVVFEGLSVGGAYIMGNVRGGLADRAGRGEKLGQDSPIRIIEADIDPKTGQPIAGSGPGSTFGGNPPSHYNIAQRAIVTVVQNSRGLAPMVLWTAHEMTNDPEKDSFNKELLVGPEVVGKAMTGSIQRIFNNTLHAQAVSKRVKQDDSFTAKKVDELDLEYRLYTRDHFNANGLVTMRYKACTRGVGADFPQFFTTDNPGEAIVQFYQALYELRQQKALDMKPQSV